MSTKLFRIEAFNDVHARWLPASSPDGGLCLPPRGSDDVSEYTAACNSQSIGGRGRAVTKSRELLASESDIPVIRVINGDEFQGTPLFSLPKDDSDNNYGYATTGLSEWLEGAEWSVMSVGNHELDLGIDEYRKYVDEITDLGLLPVCTNCEFGSDECADLGQSLLPKYLDKEVAGKTIRMLGFIPSAIHTLSSLPSVCPVYTCKSKEVTDALKDAADDASVDFVFVLSHLGVDPSTSTDSDIECVQYWNEQDGGLTTKLKGVFGSHSHTVPCGGEFLDKDRIDLDNRTYKVDSFGGNDIFATCYASTYFTDTDEDTPGLALIDLPAGTANDADAIGYQFPIMIGDVPIFHTGMHSFNFTNISFDENGSIVDAELIPLSHDITYDASLFSDAIEQMMARNNDVVATIDTPNDTGFLRSPCKANAGDTGVVGCDGGVFYAHAQAAFGTKYLADKAGVNIADDEPIVAMVNGGAVRSDISEGDASWIDLNTCFPFLNYAIMVKVSGATLIENIKYGFFKFGGLQLAGARMRTAKDFDILTLKGAAESTCPSEAKTHPRKKATPNTYAELTANTERAALAFANKKRSNRDITSATTRLLSSKALTSDKDCPVAPKGNDSDPWSHVVFEVSTTLAGIYNNAEDPESDGSSPNVYGTEEYLDCLNWEIIEEDREYWLHSTDYMYNGGDGYCLKKGANEDTFYMQENDSEIVAGMTGVAIYFAENVDNVLTPFNNNWIVNTDAALPAIINTSAIMLLISIMLI